MTSYTVTWHPVALDLLAKIWLAAAGQNDVSVASDTIDAELAVNALEKGQHVGQRFRRMAAPPLEVFYEVVAPDRLVRVRLTETTQWQGPGGNGHEDSH